ncbi:ATP-binding protein [Acetivibrio clariflavus]
MKYYTNPDLLILDELGLKKLNQNSVDDFYEIVSRRYEERLYNNNFKQSF